MLVLHFERRSFANYRGFPYSVRFSICRLKFLERYKRDNSILWPMKFFLFESFCSFLQTRRYPACFFFLSFFPFFRNVSSSFLFSFPSFFVCTSKRNPLLVVSHCFLRQRVTDRKGGGGRFSKEGWEILTSKTYFRGIHGTRSDLPIVTRFVQFVYTASRDFHRRINKVTSHFNF